MSDVGRTWVWRHSMPSTYKGALLRVCLGGDRHVTLFADGKVKEWSLEERTSNNTISWEGWEEFKP